MGILSWDKPKKIKSTAAWKSWSADGAPPGVYCPNMSVKDMEKWKAKLVGHKSGDPRVEIRKTAGAQILIVVRLPNPKWQDAWGDEVNVKISANGPIHFSFADLPELQTAIHEAREKLEAHK